MFLCPDLVKLFHKNTFDPYFILRSVVYRPKDNTICLIIELKRLKCTQLNKLQRVQNSAARLITRSRSRESITPVLQELHWLRVKKRIVFKILLLTFQCLRNTAPIYLQALIKRYSPSRNLRSNNKSLLIVPSTNTLCYGSRSFHAASPHLWNNLPECVKQADSTEKFKSMLKTYLFIQ